MFISSAFAQTAPAAAGGSDIGSSLMSMLPLLLMFVVLYFVMIRPQMKRQKEHKAMIDALAKGEGTFLDRARHLAETGETEEVRAMAGFILSGSDRSFLTPK